MIKYYPKDNDFRQQDDYQGWVWDCPNPKTKPKVKSFYKPEESKPKNV